MEMDQKFQEHPQPTTATVQTNNPTPMSRNGLTLGKHKNISWSPPESSTTSKPTYVHIVKGYLSSYSF